LTGFSLSLQKSFGSMNSLDMFLLIPIAAGFVFGLFKGLVKELTSLLAIVLGIYGAKLFAPYAYNILINTFGISAHMAKPLSYFVLFVLIAIGMLLLARMLDKFFESISLGGLNKLLGGVFGALKFALIVSVLLNVFDAIDSRFSILKAETKQNSIAYKPVMKLAPVLWDEANSKLLKHDKKSNNEENKPENE
jgi:membrane protein required for colicin V production